LATSGCCYQKVASEMDNNLTRRGKRTKKQMSTRGQASGNIAYQKWHWRHCAASRKWHCMHLERKQHCTASRKWLLGWIKFQQRRGKRCKKEMSTSEKSFWEYCLPKLALWQVSGASGKLGWGGWNKE